RTRSVAPASPTPSQNDLSRPQRKAACNCSSNRGLSLWNTFGLAALHDGNSSAFKRRLLPRGQFCLVEIVDQLMEHPVPVDLRPEVHEHRAQPDRRAVHEHEGARRRDATETADVLVDAV